MQNVAVTDGMLKVVVDECFTKVELRRESKRDVVLLLVLPPITGARWLTPVAATNKKSRLEALHVRRGKQISPRWTRHAACAIE